MKRLTILVSLVVIANGCCAKEVSIGPPFPSISSEWRETEESGRRILGTFVLKLNEITDNGKIEIRVVELIAGDNCAEYGSYARQNKVKLQFIDHISQMVICEATFLESGSSTLFSGQCKTLPSHYGVAAVYIKAINVKDKWVYFELGA